MFFWQVYQTLIWKHILIRNHDPFMELMGVGGTDEACFVIRLFRRA